MFSFVSRAVLVDADVQLGGTYHFLRLLVYIHR
jgi:hypothetical protein